MWTDLRNAAMVSSSSGSLWVAETRPPGLALKSTPFVIIASRNFLNDIGLAFASQSDGGLLIRVEFGGLERDTVGVREDMQHREGAVSDPRHPLFLEHFVDVAAQRLAIAVGSGACVRRADDLQCRLTRRSRQRVGVEGAGMSDLFAIGSLGHLKIEQV